MMPKPSRGAPLLRWAAVATLVVLALTPPWTWFGVGQPLVTVRLEPGRWSDVGWAALVVLAMIWVTKVTRRRHKDDADRRAEELPR